jgi:molecular chaperone GrpE
VTGHRSRRGGPFGSSRPGRPSAPPSSTRGVDSGGSSGPDPDARDASGAVGADREPRGSSEGTPLVPEEESSATPEIERARAEAAEHLADLQRLKAEFDNYRKRVLREQTQAVELASGPLVMRLLEVLDEFELALTAAERVERSSDMDRFIHGVEIVYAKLIEILKAEGLERIEADGARFDPAMHEALLQGGGDPDGEPYVEDVLRTGYALKGRVIRPAGVKVARR